MILHPLPSLGKSLAPDTDHLLKQTTAGSLLLIHLPPGDYQGEMIEMPIGLRHRFAVNCDAVILTLTQS